MWNFFPDYSNLLFFFHQASCVCKENVVEADCSRCKPQHYGLSKANPKGCSACNCHKAGCFGNIATCSNTTGQCYCKEFVGGQRCGECKDGFYSLNRFNLFGCTGKFFLKRKMFLYLQLWLTNKWLRRWGDQTVTLSILHKVFVDKHF